MRRLVRVLVLVVAGLAVAACGKVEGGEPDAEVPIDAPVDSPDAPEVTMCTPDQFVDCDGPNARICNPTGDGVIVQSCGTPGCNSTQMRCNECVPGGVACDGTVLETCDATGLLLPDEPCQLSCNATAPAHCEYISPKYLPDVCDTAAAMADLTISSSVTIDTGLDTNCTGGIVTQSGGPAICVMRYGTITIQSGRTLTLTGTRAAALVSDFDLTMAGILDGSANRLVHGPGGGTASSGGLAGSTTGGGGAGNATAGGPGGSTATTGGAANGGAASDPLSGTALVGGARGARPNIGIGVSGGGGGGAVMLVSCRGDVVVTGAIDLGGGGANAGFDQVIGGQLMLLGGGGGGAGGYGVIQGAGVQVTGQIFANGGGGGGGGVNDMGGTPGGDGGRSTSGGTGGAGAVLGGGSTSQGGTGGAGGRGAGGPGSGAVPTSQGSPGGGGGAAGRFQVYAPMGVTPALAPTTASPGFRPNLTVPTR